MSPGRILDVIVVVLVLGAIVYFGRGFIGTIQAPVKLEAALGDNAALAKGAEAQNKGVDALAKAGETKKAKSQAAVDAAGKPQFAAAAKIQEAKAPGATPIERAANRINAEFAP